MILLIVDTSINGAKSDSLDRASKYRTDVAVLAGRCLSLQRPLVCDLLSARGHSATRVDFAGQH
jgi:hypothetical protein